MAYVNVAEWKTDQVCEWLKGLENTVLPYVHSFMNHNVSGQQLLSLRPEDLEHLGVFKLGHQEIILEAVEYLRNFHYDLDRENLQLLAMHLSCQAHSLHNELCRQTDAKAVTTQNLSDVVAIITAVKQLVRWLDRPPFSGHLDYNDKKTELLKLSLEMATCAQRDRFAEKPIEEIRTTCEQMAKVADYFIQDVADPIIIQPSYLEQVTLKKRPGDDLGFCIMPSFHGAHQIADIKYNSPAHLSRKMEEGDEVVQVNYQTIVGWERKSVLELLRESPNEMVLTVKRRPKHTKTYGQIYIKPIRLPNNKKTSYASRWQYNIPSPRPELLTIPDFTMPLPRHSTKVAQQDEPASIIDTGSILDTITTDDSSGDSDSELEPAMSRVRLYSAKPRSLVQRRATITGASPTVKHSIDIEQLWRELKRERSGIRGSGAVFHQLRDKAASCAHGLDNVTHHHQQTASGSLGRPQTCLGIAAIPRRHQASPLTSNTVDPKRVQFNDGSDLISPRQQQPANNAVSDSGKEKIPTAQETDNRRVYAESDSKGNDGPNHLEDNLGESSRSDSVSDVRETAASPSRGGKERGRLDKSHSTPAYDLTESDDDFIERKFEAALDEHLKQQQQARAAVAGSSKTDSKLFDSVEDLDEHLNRPLTPKSVVEELDIDGIVGNVAKKISDIEKNINHKSSSKTVDKNAPKPLLVTEKKKSNIHIRINDVDVDDRSDEPEADSGNITADFDSDDETVGTESTETNSSPSKLDSSSNTNKDNNQSAESSRESSEDKSESTSSYIEGVTTSYSSDGDVALGGKKDLPVTANDSFSKDAESEDGYLVPIKLMKDRSENLSPIIQLHRIDLISNISNKYPPPPSPGSISLPARPETPKRDVSMKPEAKPRLTPPEPPPRKYFTKPVPLDLTVNQEIDRPRVPDRPSPRRDLRKPDVPPEVYPRDEKNSLDHRRRFERLDTYSDFVEKSTDFIDEPSTPQSDKKTPTPLLDPYGYTQIPETCASEDSFSPSSTHSSSLVEQRKFDYNLQNIDTADGSCMSRQGGSGGCSTPTPDGKSRSLEKDKTHDRGIVNRAMMVARSMGLHGNSVKLTNSPKSPRKRNTILAKRRNVGVKDIAPGELEGWLTYRSRGAGGAWARAWFILKGASLYRFSNQSSTKADCLIALSGFTASQASEVNSRKFAFKVYYTGTVFYFAADAEDTLAMWLDAINRATLGADRTSGLFTETDESDCDSKQIKPSKNSKEDSKPLVEKTFGSLKKLGRRDPVGKDHEITGASLDRKYLKFLGGRTQNVPVPTAQFRSYRRVLPSSTPNKKPEKMSSPDLQVTIAGSTFYGLNASQSATDVLSTSQDMGDYRRTTDRSRSSRNNQRPEELQGFITLEEFMLARQEEECRNNNTRFTPLNNDHVHIQHRNIADGSLSSIVQNNGMIYGSPRNGDDALPPTPPPPNPPRSEHPTSNHSFDGSEAGSYSSRCDSIKSKSSKKSWEPSCLQKKKPLANNNYESGQSYSPVVPARDPPLDQSSVTNDNPVAFSTLDYGERLKPQPWARSTECNANFDYRPNTRRILRNEGHSGSSGDLSCHTCSDTLQRTRKECSIGRNGSFNIADRRRRDHVVHPERNWPDTTHANDNQNFHIDQSSGRLKHVAQYQPPPIPLGHPFDQDGMRTAFEMHLDKGSDPMKKNNNKGLRNFFGSKSPQKNACDQPREHQKTLLGSPRLHRALFRDRSSNQRQNSRSGSQSPGDSGIGQSYSSCSGESQCQTYNQNFSAVACTGEWCSDAASQTPNCMMSGVAACQKRPTPRNPLVPPTLPYIPPPTSPPPDYPGLEYPPVFEPGTYTLSDASLLRHRSTKNGHNFGD
ncbi:hypothetical protein QAD02_004262 [Eretmocerus hayati]|uniref:Uncharacterized protein n=1 Tax=Eretmocerus hayati TaxID=131215 RepID=A0ACC2NQW0_9HYME|nr:hypothetical protein QAD02_004262 [Eretmocerus hayati]